MISKKKLFKKLNYLVLLIFIGLAKSSLAENSLLMVTSEYCLYCQIWEKQIGKIYPKTDIAKNYPLKKLELDDFLNNENYNVVKTKITPTFIFFEDKNEIGRITGYSNPEMFWWQVDEILQRE
tara:strand:- start:143 stop:511 length:369 start_codon:yes stop_codon:yes gene_type:complete